MADSKSVWVVVLPRCSVAFDGGLFTGGTVLQMPKDVADAHAEDADGNPAMVKVVKDAKDGHATYKKLRAAYFQTEHGKRKPDNMPNDEQLSRLYGGVAA